MKSRFTWKQSSVSATGEVRGKTALSLEPWVTSGLYYSFDVKWFLFLTTKKQLLSPSLPVLGVLNEVLYINVPSGTWHTDGTFHSVIYLFLKT